MTIFQYKFCAPRCPYYLFFLFVVGVSGFTNLDLFKKWLKLKTLGFKKSCEELKKYVLTKKHSCQEKIIKNFLKLVEKRWKICKRDQSKFRKKYSTWLELDAVLEKQKPGAGRPPKKFENCGERAKQKKVKKIMQATTKEELLFATEMMLRKQGRRTAANMVHEIGKQSCSTRTRKHAKSTSVVPLSPDEALALIINTKSSKATYLAYREAAKNCNANIYPSWHNILAAKQACYPASSSIKLSDVEVECNLQDLLHLTARRICELQEDVLTSVSNTEFVLFCKWGMDGSSGQSNYKQMTSTSATDSSVIIISFVPLKLSDKKNKSNVLWHNPVPSSTRFCRAIKFIFAKETAELTLREIGKIQEKIKNVQTFHYKEKNIDFELKLTMIDGKVCNALTHNKATQNCYICLAKPKDMNNLGKVVKCSANPENYEFGLSTLHSWIRFLECSLHIAYRLEIKTWQAKGENKEIMNRRKKQIIDRLKKELGILVDQPKPGYGSTNTGNTARIFFRNASKSAEITGLNEELLQRFSIILQTISCGFEVDSDKFGMYALDTAKLYVSLYPWYCMPPSVHKVLIHGGEIVKKCVLPIGQLGEEAQESKNKDFKFIREHRSRKDSAEHTNKDLFNYFILSSDPIISSVSLKKRVSKNKLKLHLDTLKLLKSPSIPSINTDSDFSNSESD